MDNTDNQNSKLSLDRRSLLQHINSEIDQQVMDAPNVYIPNDPRHPLNIQLQPLFKQRQFSQTASFSHGNIMQVPLSPSKSLDLSCVIPKEQIAAEKQYHYLPGDEPELNKSTTLPKSLSRDDMYYPPYPIPQPPPRSSPMDRNNVITANTSMGKQGFIRDPLEKRGQQTFSTFLEDKHYETLEKREQHDTAQSSVASFPPSKPIMTNVKNMKIDEDDTIVRKIVKKKKNKNYTTKWLFILFQLFLIVLILGVAAVAIIALLEVKKLEGPATPNAMVGSTDIENQITNLTSTISGLKTQIASLTQQLTSAYTTLGARVVSVEDERTQLNIQIQSINRSLIETGNSSIGPCIHSRRSCRASIGNVCVPNGNHELLQIKEGYEVTSVWCEGVLDDQMQSLEDLSRISTYVSFFPNLSPQAYECGCRIDEPTGSIYGCVTNIVQCKV